MPLRWPYMQARAMHPSTLHPPPPFPPPHVVPLLLWELVHRGHVLNARAARQGQFQGVRAGLGTGRGRQMWLVGRKGPSSQAAPLPTHTPLLRQLPGCWLTC